jgi:hypothetical protein
MTGGSSSGLFVRPYEVGDSVVVLYPPADPGRGTIRRFSDLWLGPMLFGALGGACVLFWYLPKMQAPARSP